ncbi:MAG: hypothetical protein AAF078_03440 [Planctomycetota bacterium]
MTTLTSNQIRTRASDFLNFVDQLHVSWECIDEVLRELNLTVPIVVTIGVDGEPMGREAALAAAIEAFEEIDELEVDALDGAEAVEPRPASEGQEAMSEPVRGVTLGFVPIEGEWTLAMGAGPADADPLGPGWYWTGREGWDRQQSVLAATAAGQLMDEVEFALIAMTDVVESAAASVGEALHRLRVGVVAGQMGRGEVT